MKLVTFRTGDGATHAGVIHENTIFQLPYPTLLELLRDPRGMKQARSAPQSGQGERYDYDPNAKVTSTTHPNTVSSIDIAWRGTTREQVSDQAVLLSPIPDPPTMRDFYAFEQHVKTARFQRGLGVIPEWYEVPIFYFTNTSEIYGHNSPVPYPKGCRELDFELEIACVIGREGKDIAVEEAADYIAGYTIMNDWSARDFQRRDMKLNLGPGKGKDFATSLGPWLVTPDELAPHRNGTGASERYDLTMLARINGKEVSRGNFKDIHYSFPQLIAWASQNVRLRVGDVIGSGTVGTGCILELGPSVLPFRASELARPQGVDARNKDTVDARNKGLQSWLQSNDVVEMEIDGIGVLRNKII